jgi:DNA-binding MarR family transcriptional regulator
MAKSAKKILLVLSVSPFLNQKQLQALTGLSIRSVKGSLKILKEMGYVEELVDFTDMRQKTYKLGGEVDV